MWAIPSEGRDKRVAAGRRPRPSSARRYAGSMQTWGPDARPAAVAIAFAGLATPAPDHPVTPALPLLLRVLSDRGLYATFFVEPQIAAAEPFALEMIDLSRNEVGLLARPGASIADGLASLREAGSQPSGALVAAASGADAGGAGAGDADASVGAGDANASDAGAGDVGAGYDGADGLAYLAVPGVAPAFPERGEDGVVRIPVAQDDAGSPSSFHLAFQAAVGRTLPQHGLLAIAPPAHQFERQDALDVLVESLDLIAGLRRAERLWTPSLGELAASL